MKEYRCAYGIGCKDKCRSHCLFFCGIASGQGFKVHLVQLPRFFGIKLLDEPSACPAVICFDGIRHTLTVPDDFLADRNLKVYYSVDCTGSGAFLYYRSFTGRQYCVQPCRRNVHASGLVSSGTSNALGELVYVEAAVAVVVFCKLKLIDAHRYVIKECSHFLMTYYCRVETLNIGSEFRIAPY